VSVGTWLVPVDEEVHQRVEELRFPGESDDRSATERPSRREATSPTGRLPET